MQALFPEKGIASSWQKQLRRNSEQPCDMQPGSALQVSELELLRLGRDCKFGVALPAHVFAAPQTALAPHSQGIEPLCLCAAFTAAERGSLQSQLHHAAVIPQDTQGGAISATVTHMELSPRIAAPFPVPPARGPPASSPFTFHPSLGPALTQTPPTLVPHRPLPPLAPFSPPSAPRLSETPTPFCQLGH